MSFRIDMTGSIFLEIAVGYLTKAKVNPTEFTYESMWIPLWYWFNSNT